MEEKRISPLKAIRLKCLDCCCSSSNEVKLCTVERCPLYPFREGRDPYRKKTELTPEQREERRNSLALAREKQRNSQIKSQNTQSEGTYIPGDNSKKISNRTEEY